MEIGFFFLLFHPHLRSTAALSQRNSRLERAGFFDVVEKSESRKFSENPRWGFER